MNKRETVWTAGLYLRLSKEDKNKQNAYSMSIENQKILLTKTAKESGIIVGGIYIDDGLSGVFFDRPEFKRMIADLESGKINCVLVKDLSRLGRNNAEANHYYEDIFIVNGYRFIAVDDNVDTLRGYEAVAGFKNFYNEMYPRDISQKTRSAYRSMALDGKFLGAKAPYGYKKDPQDKHRLIIDEETAPVVRHIFDLAIQGHGRRKIAKILRDEKIFTPAAYAKTQGITHYDAITVYDDYMWSDVTVGEIIENEIYIGNMVNHRKEKPFKSKKFRDVPKENWIVVENTHEPIIDKKTFDEAQALIHNRRRTTKQSGEVQIFSGLVKCRDCKKALIFSAAKRAYVCSTYNFKGKTVCTSHYIKYDDLYGVVLADIYCKTKALEKDRETLYRAALKCNEKKLLSETKENQVQLSKAEKRMEELEILIKKTYENSILGNLAPDRMTSLLQDYETEQAELKEKAEKIQTELSEHQKCKENAGDFVTLIEKYIGIRELTAPILNELIDRIEVGSKYEHQGETYQDINIYYKFVGTVELNDDMYFTEDAG